MKKNESKAIGGLARAEKLTPEQRGEIAAKAAMARWGAKTPHMTHKGNFKESFGINIPCYVLNDASKTAVISQSGMGMALGLGTGGSRLPRFFAGKAMSNFVGPEIREKLDNPIIFHSVKQGQKSPLELMSNGYDVTLLIDLCNVILTAKNANTKMPETVIKQARIVINASAKAGIQGLVYALAGFDRTNEEVIAAYAAFVQEEVKKYEAEFPRELYLEWARLYGHKLQRSWKDMHLTIDHIYFPLAKSEGKLLNLLREARASAGVRNAKLFQFLNEIGARALRFQLGRVYEIAQSSATQEIYENEIAKRFGGQQLLSLANT